MLRCISLRRKGCALFLDLLDERGMSTRLPLPFTLFLPLSHPCPRRHQDAEATGAAGGSLIEGLTSDLSLKAGERITIKVNVNGSAAAKPAAAASSGLMGGKLRPPSSAGGLRPPPAAGGSGGGAGGAGTSGGAAGGDLMAGLGAAVAGLSVAAPAPKPAPADDWVSF